MSQLLLLQLIHDRTPYLAEPTICISCIKRGIQLHNGLLEGDSLSLFFRRQRYDIAGPVARFSVSTVLVAKKFQYNYLRTLSILLSGLVAVSSFCLFSSLFLHEVIHCSSLPLITTVMMSNMPVSHIYIYIYIYALQFMNRQESTVVLIPKGWVLYIYYKWFRTNNWSVA